MKIILNPINLRTEFARLLQNYRHYYWVVAWAGQAFDLVEELTANSHKIEKMVVGLHFYQTHPDFIQTFIEHPKVKYVRQTDGTFHPKFYLFYNDERDWALLTGSANFTNSAFHKNTEASVLIESTDQANGRFLQEAMAFIDNCWQAASNFKQEELEQYRSIWKNQQTKIKSLSARYGGTGRKRQTAGRSIHTIPVLNMTWPEFIQEVRKEGTDRLEQRIKVLEVPRDAFRGVNHFHEIRLEERKFIAGIPNRLFPKEEVDYGYFGSMQGAGTFKKHIIENDERISKALDQIPFSGQVTRQQYENYVDIFSSAFEKKYIAPATRLLAMKRPDIFICFDGKNKKGLCEDFEITQSGLNFDRYWTEIIERILDSNWWNNPQPQSEEERKISAARAAFLDAIYYEE